MSLLIDLTKSVRGKSIEKVSQENHAERVRICASCPSVLVTGNCLKCGCFVVDKAKYKDEHCDDEKW